MPYAPAFISGFALAAALIVAIGAQNIFVLRQGLRREYVGATVTFCITVDVLLMAATETTTDDDIARLCDALSEAL